MEIKICDVFSDCLNNINLEFKEKSITALIGSDNSCKTNLINLINGQQKINKGYIKYGRKIDFVGIFFLNKGITESAHHKNICNRNKYIYICNLAIFGSP